jgi:hypothetical protein
MPVRMMTKDAKESRLFVSSSRRLYFVVVVGIENAPALDLLFVI